jgi:hypothetical protein
MNKPLKTLDRVTLDGKPVAARRKIYLLLYKPKGCITTYKDPQGRPTVYDLIPTVREWVFPVGRLDQDTSGLLIGSSRSRDRETDGTSNGLTETLAPGRYPSQGFPRGRTDARHPRPDARGAEEIGHCGFSHA